jgi:hypothetical protein
MIPIKNKKIKPVDYSISLIYQCTDCNSQHWISLKAAKTKGYMIVCDCGCILKTKLVEDIKIIYKKTISKKIDATKNVSNYILTDENNAKKEIPELFLCQCVSILIGYGFTKNEASSIVTKTYNKYPECNLSQLIKLSLSSIGVNNEQSSSQAG